MLGSLIRNYLIPELARIETRLARMETTMSASFDALKAEVARTATVEASVATLVQGLVDKLAEAKASGSDAEFDSLVQQLRSATDPLAKAVTENTPAAPATPAAQEPAATAPANPAEPATSAPATDAPSAS